MGQGILEFPKFVIAEIPSLRGFEKAEAISRNSRIPYYVILGLDPRISIGILEFPSSLS